MSTQTSTERLVSSLHRSKWPACARGRRRHGGRGGGGDSRCRRCLSLGNCGRGLRAGGRQVRPRAHHNNCYYRNGRDYCRADSLSNEFHLLIAIRRTRYMAPRHILLLNIALYLVYGCSIVYDGVSRFCAVVGLTTMSCAQTWCSWPYSCAESNRRHSPGGAPRHQTGGLGTIFVYMGQDI